MCRFGFNRQKKELWAVWKQCVTGADVISLVRPIQTQGPRVYITSPLTFTNVNGNDIPLHKSYEQYKKEEEIAWPNVKFSNWNK
jgi:hypothetical protein